MRKIGSIFCTIGLTTILAACGGGGNGDTGTSSSSDQGSKSEQGDTSGNVNVDASAARDVFQQNCSSCHGENLQGGVGPNLDKIGSKLSESEILAQIKNGGGGMPSNVIQGDDAKNVAAWLASMK